MNIIDEIKDSYRSGSTLIKLIYVNLIVFFIVKLFGVAFFLFNINGDGINPVIEWLAVPAETGKLLLKPWTILSYMFLHEGFLHILFNMLWLFWFGKIFLEYLNQKQLLSTYILGGLSGAVLYIIAFNI